MLSSCPTAVFSSLFSILVKIINYMVTLILNKVETWQTAKYHKEIMISKHRKHPEVKRDFQYGRAEINFAPWLTSGDTIMLLRAYLGEE